MIRPVLTFFGVVIAQAMLFCGVSSAQAFGFGMGTPVSSLKGAEIANEDGPLKTYKLETAPFPHSEFSSFMVLATEREGICKVAGIGRDHQNDADGYDIRAAFDALSDGLKAKYKGGRKYDFLHRGSIWDEPQ